MPFGRLVHERATTVRVLRAGAGARVEAEGAALGVRLLASSARRAAHDLYVVEAEPGAPRVADPHLPGTVEHLVLVSGRMRLGPAGEEVELAPGDYATFPGDVPHRYQALTPGTRAVLLMEHT